MSRSIRWLVLGSITLVLGIGCVSVGGADEWPQWFGPNRDGIWRETGLLDKFPEGGPKVLWRVPTDLGYSGPAVAYGKVYLTDWVRDKDENGKDLKPTKEQGLLGTERVRCLDAQTGKILWEHTYACPYRISYPFGPRTTPTVTNGRVYTIGAMGDMVCLDAEKGTLIWKKNVVSSYGLTDRLPSDPKELEKAYSKMFPVWGYAASLLVEGDLVYSLVGGPGSAVVAFNKDTGAEVWKALETQEVGYAPPMIYKLGGPNAPPQLIIWLSESLNSLDPATGKVYWTVKFPSSGKLQRPYINIVTPRMIGQDELLVSTFYNGSMLVKVTGNPPKADVVWEGKSDNPQKPDTLHSSMATPIVVGDYIYGCCAWGELRCLELKTGKSLWTQFDVVEKKKAFCGTAFLIPNGNRCFIWNDQGELILAELSPKGYKEISRAKLIEPVHETRGRSVVWTHPAFAHKHMYVRNFKEIICVDLSSPQ